MSLTKDEKKNTATECRALNREKILAYICKNWGPTEKRHSGRGNEFGSLRQRGKAMQKWRILIERKRKRGKKRGETNKVVAGEETSEKRSRSAPRRIGMIEPSDLPWQLRTTSCQMMGRVLINNTGSDWLPAGSSRVRYTESRERWFWLQTNSTWLPSLVVRTGGGEGVKRGWFRHVTKRRATCTRLSHGGWIWAMRFSIERC